MRIAVCSHFTEAWQPLADITMDNLSVYCATHGYIKKVERVPQYERYDGKVKLRMVKEALEIADVVLVMDCDCMITNHTIKVEDFIDDEHDFYICEDYNSINAGVFIIKKSNWSLEFVDYILETIGEYHCEQNVIEKYFRTFGLDKIKLLNHPSINSYLYENYPEIPLQSHELGQWQISDFILHLPGLPLEKRLKIFEEIKPMIVYE